MFTTGVGRVLARYAGVRAVAFWVGALIAMSIYMAECLCCSGSICAGALMLIFGGLLVRDLWLYIRNHHSWMCTLRDSGWSTG